MRQIRTPTLPSTVHSKSLAWIKSTYLVYGNSGIMLTRQALYVWRNMEALSHNHCFSGKAKNDYVSWLCVCSLKYPAYNAPAPYCHLRPVTLYNIFPHYFINCTIFEKKQKNVTEHKMCVWISSTSYIWNISHSKKNWARYVRKCILVFM